MSRLQSSCTKPDIARTRSQLNYYRLKPVVVQFEESLVRRGVRAIAGIFICPSRNRISRSSSNPPVAGICSEVGVVADQTLVGSEAGANARLRTGRGGGQNCALHSAVARRNQRIITTLQAKRSVTGFLGDGISDAPAIDRAERARFRSSVLTGRCTYTGLTFSAQGPLGP